MSMKDAMLKAIQELPTDATVADAMERLYLLDKIERGIAQEDDGRTVPLAEARRRLARWLPPPDTQAHGRMS